MVYLGLLVAKCDSQSVLSDLMPTTATRGVVQEHGDKD